jgi:hypothetical protein
MAGSEGKSYCQTEELSMKKFILLTAFINLIFFSACSSETSGTKPLNTSNINTASVNAANNGAVVDTVNANLPPANSNVDSNIQQANRKIVNAPANYKEPGAIPVAGAPAPYNSTINSTMNKQNEFLEIREFKGDPMLLRMERTQQSKKIRLFLKNGKVVNLPYEKNDLFLAASPNEILTAAGITPPTVKPAQNEQKNNETVKKP